MEKERRMNKPMLGSITVAATTTFFGWAALHLVPQKQDWHWVIYLAGLLAMPGVLFSVAVAAIFSPQGFHGGDDFTWIVVPVNLLFYFLLFFLLLRRKGRAD
jgi:H+/Cl- antiporter ClcA